MFVPQARGHCLGNRAAVNHAPNNARHCSNMTVLLTHAECRAARTDGAPLHLPAKVCMPGCVHGVEGVRPVLHGSVLGQDGDASLPLQGVAVHEALAWQHGAAGGQQAVEQRCLSSVHMGCSNTSVRLSAADW